MANSTEKVLLGGALVACCCMCCGVAAGNEPGERVLFDAGTVSARKSWRAVNDGVMGGLSRGGPRIDGDRGLLEFSGTLSLENNGGFSSIRSEGPAGDLRTFDGVEVRFRGDGRTYFFTLHTDYRIRAGSYRAKLPTAAGEWNVVRLPFGEFQATSFGRPLRDAPPVNRGAIESFGFLLADKRRGPFRLEVDSIKAYADRRETKDIVAMLERDGSFKTLLAALEAAALVPVLKGDGPFTVFAPTDEAFAALARDTVDALLEPENRSELREILLYHVIRGRVSGSDVLAAGSARTIQGRSMLFSERRGTVRANGAAVTAADLQASNGVIHRIDSVLTPPRIVDTSGTSSTVRARRVTDPAIERGVPLDGHGRAAARTVAEVTALEFLALDGARQSASRGAAAGGGARG